MASSPPSSTPMQKEDGVITPGITRVMLWAIPRSASTAFLKCMSYVPETQAWYEPYWQCFHYSKYGVHRKEILEFKGKYYGAGVRDDDEHLRDISGGYLASDTQYPWVKEQLESTPPGKNMIICKDLLAWPGEAQYDDIPRGFQHTFLIRHPYPVFDSWKKALNRNITDDDKKLKLGDFPEFYMPKGSFYVELYDMYKYATETLGQRAAIVDSDELLANPKGVMKAYFNAIGVPFKDEYLEWHPGDDVMMENRWVVAKEKIYGQRHSDAWHGAVFESSGFSKPRPVPKRNELADDVVYYGDLCMKYYEEMYANRLKPL